MTTTVSVLTRSRDVSRRVNVPTSALGYPSLAATPAVPALLRLSAAALAAAFFAIVYLHSVSIAELRPMSTTVSDLVFVHGIGWLFTMSTAPLGIASVALTVALARNRRTTFKQETVMLNRFEDASVRVHPTVKNYEWRKSLVISAGDHLSRDCLVGPKDNVRARRGWWSFNVEIGGKSPWRHRRRSVPPHRSR